MLRMSRSKTIKCKIGLILGVMISLNLLIQSANAAATASSLRSRENSFVTGPPRVIHGMNSQLLSTVQIFQGDQRVDEPRYSSNSLWIAGKLSNGNLWYLNLATRRQAEINIQGHRIYDFEFSPDSTQIMVRFTRKDHDCCQVFELKTGQSVSSVIEGNGSYFPSRYSKNGKWILTQFEKTIRVTDAKTFRETGIVIEKELNNDDYGDYLFGLGASGTVKVSDLKTGKKLAVTHIGKDSQVTESVSLQGQLVIAEQLWFGTGVPILRDLKTLAPIQVGLDSSGIPMNARMNSHFLSPDGGLLYTEYSSDNNGQNLGVLWETRTGKQIRRVLNAHVAHFSGNSQYVAVEVDAFTENKSTFIMNRNDSTEYIMEGEFLGFAGNNVITSLCHEETQLHAVLFFNLVSGDTNILNNFYGSATVSPNGETVFYINEGILTVLERL